MRLLADENFPAAAVMLLRQRGRDVLSIAEVMPGAPDRAVLSRARRDGRVLVTFDGDFGALVFRTGELPPPGIVFLRFIPQTPEEPGHVVEDLLARGDLELAGKLTVVDSRRIRQRRLPRT